MNHQDENRQPAVPGEIQSHTGLPRSAGDSSEASDRAVRLPVKVLSTSLGMTLAAHMLLAPGLLMGGSGAFAAETAQPTLSEWSTEEVKAYYDASVDWSLPALPEEELQGVVPQMQANTGTGGASGSTGGGNTTIIHQGSSFGWDDMLLYHLLFNSGGSYSSGRWHQSYPSYDARTNQPYQPKTYSAGTFQNKQVPGSNVKPKTSVSSGSFNTKSGSINKATASKSGTTSGSSSGSSNSGTSGTSAGTGTKPATGQSSSASKPADNATKSSTGSSTSSGSTSSGSSSSVDSSKSSSSSSSSSKSSSSSSSSSSKSSSSGSIGGKSSGFSGSSSSGS
ncbi:hypothetical protein [Paenibacillus mesotrionivorans]|uniref:Uncharacterized protein n=1 Tax=Paenibacillus mesotrionivorans TaxID=3160968 RepID=A0ACC7P0I3_9BACL